MADVTKRGAREEEMKKSGKGNRKEGEEGTADKRGIVYVDIRRRIY